MIIFKHKYLPLYIFSSFAIFIIGSIIGLCIGPIVYEEEQAFSFLNSPICTMDGLTAFIIIATKNIPSTFIIMSIGILGFRSLPTLCLLFNGCALGMTAVRLDYNLSYILATIFPHGYIEFPLLFFTAACSFILVDIIKKSGLNAYTLLKSHKNPHIRYALKNYLLDPYIIIVVPGIIIAAIIEATFSFWNLRLLAGVC